MKISLKCSCTLLGHNPHASEFVSPLRGKTHLPPIVSAVRSLYSYRTRGTLKQFHQTATHRINQFFDLLTLDILFQKQFKDHRPELIYYVPTLRLNRDKGNVRRGRSSHYPWLWGLPEWVCVCTQKIVVSHTTQIASMLLCRRYIQNIQFMWLFQTVAISLLGFRAAHTLLATYLPSSLFLCLLLDFFYKFHKIWSKLLVAMPYLTLFEKMLDFSY